MTIYSIEAEQELLGAVLSEPDLINQVSEIVTAADFFRADHIAIFSAMADLSAKGEGVDIVALSEESKGLDLAYLIELQTNSAGRANVKYYAKIVRDKSKRRELLRALDEAAELAHTDNKSKADAVIASAASLIGQLQVSEGAGIRGVSEIIKSLGEKWQQRMDLGGKIDGLETGLGLLDQRFMGWKPGDLIFIGARPSMGKSVLAFQIGLHNAVNHAKNVLGFSVEMTAEQIMERSMANLGKIPLPVFKKCDKDEFGRYNDQLTIAAHKLSKAKIRIDDTPGIHINQIMARARAAHRRESLDLVIVDHIHIVNGEGQSREREIAGITGALKMLAKELGCPVIAVGQLNREVEKRNEKRPQMSDLRDSGSVEQDADIVLLLYREEYYKPDTTEKGILEIITGKYREGETGSDHFSAQLDKSLIADLDFLYRPPAPNASSYRAGLD